MSGSEHTDNEDTIIGFNEDTIISLDQDTIVSADKTVASRRRVDPVDDSTRVSRRGRDQGLATPGRISGGRVAVVPGEKVQRYAIRTGDLRSPDVLRTAVDIPVSEARQSRDIQALGAESHKGLRRRGILVLASVPFVSLFAAAIVVAIMLLLGN